MSIVSENLPKPNEISESSLVEKSQEISVAEAVEANHDMWRVRFNLDRIRTKSADNITLDDRQDYERIKEDWRTKRDNLVRLLQALPEDLAAQVDITPPVNVGDVLISHGTEAGPDIAGETRIRPDEEEVVAKPKVDTSLKLGSMAGRDYTNMTMEEIDAMIFNAKATAKSTHDTGIADEGLSLWKEQKRLKQEAEDEAREKAKAEVKRIQAEEKEAEKLAKEKEEAEARAKKAEETQTALGKLYHDIWNKKQELENAIQNFQRSKKYNIIESAGWEADENRLTGELKGLEKQKKGLEKELAKLEEGVGTSFKSRFKDAYEKTKKLTFFGEEGSEVAATGEPKPAEIIKPEEMPASPPPKVELAKPEAKLERSEQERVKKKFSLWKWTKERVKTFFKDGGLFGEFVQAETTRKGTGHAASSAEALSTLIKTEWDIDNSDAVQDVVNEALKTEKKTGISLDSKMIEEIAGKRKESNDDEKNYIIKDAVENLKRNLVKARGQATSETVLSPENLVQVEAEMKKELNKISDAALVKDFKGFAKVMRDNLDKYWWLRYLYGGAEWAALIGGTIYMALPGPEQVAAAKAAGGAKGGAAAAEGLRQSGEVMINKSVWKTLETLAQNHGVNLVDVAQSQGFGSTDQLLQNWSQQVLDLNNSYEPEWASKVADGLLSSRQMPVGMMLKIPGVIMAILGNIRLG